MITDSIQEGVYFRPGENAPPAYRLLLLNVTAGATAADVAAGLASIWTMLSELRAGRVRDLDGQPELHGGKTTQQFSDLAILIAYGRRLFDANVHDPPVTEHERSPYLAYFDPQVAFPSLPWSAQKTPGEADIALQFTASSAAAVNCAAIEVWKTVEDGDLPLEPVMTYDGFGRLDRRGWLDFHDGVSNMASTMRAQAIAASAPDWMRGGTYMAFLRIRVDLRVWRGLGRVRQEVAVGRDKLTGAALKAVRETDTGDLILDAMPFDPDDPEAVAEWRDPSQRGDPHVENTHIHRANQSRASPGAPGGFRMFRQGYEFLHGIGPDGPRLGLNFVSFQHDFRVFQHVMNAPGWLGDSAFGGDAPQELLTLEAGGFYASPPLGDAFPGRVLFRGR